MRPIEPRRLAPPARHRDQEPGEVAPDRLPQPPSGFPEPRKLGRCQIVRPGLRRLGAARAGDQGARVGLDVPGVLAPVQKARQGTEPRARDWHASSPPCQELAHVRRGQIGCRHVLCLHGGERQPHLRDLIGDILRGRQTGAAHLGPARQARARSHPPAVAAWRRACAAHPPPAPSSRPPDRRQRQPAP